MQYWTQCCCGLTQRTQILRSWTAGETCRSVPCSFWSDRHAGLPLVEVCPNRGGLMDQYQAAMVRSARNGGVVCVQGEALLLDGQDPTCIVVESALNIAVVRGHKEIVGVQFDTARVPHAALRHAVIHCSILICQQLLQAKADPSLPDRRGCRSIHCALSGVTTSASAWIAEESCSVGELTQCTEMWMTIQAFPWQCLAVLRLYA